MNHLVLDFETTGLDPAVHDPIQVAALLLDDDLVETGVFSSLIRPLRPENASPEAIAVHGYTLDQLAEAPPAVQVWRELCGFVGRGNLRYVGQNCKFDLGFLAVAENSHGFSIGIHAVPIDVVELARIHLQATGKVDSCKLGVLTAYYSISHQAHDALGDVRATAEVLRRIRAEAPDLVAAAYEQPIYAWLLDHAGSGSFQESLRGHYRDKGWLSPKQVCALVNCVNEINATTTAR